jgi:hypothetical protein
MTDRAVAGYDEKHEYDLVDAITTAIAESSMISHANAMVIGTGETASAFLSCLATVLAMSPSAVRSPAAIRKAIEELGNASANEASEEMQDLLRRTFHTDVGGHA